MSDFFKNFGQLLLAPASAAIGQASLIVANDMGWYPQRQLAEMLGGAIDSETARWIIFAIVSIVVWLMVDRVGYKENCVISRLKRAAVKPWQKQGSKSKGIPEIDFSKIVGPADLLPPPDIDGGKNPDTADNWVSLSDAAVWLYDNASPDLREEILRAMPDNPAYYCLIVVTNAIWEEAAVFRGRRSPQLRHEIIIVEKSDRFTPSVEENSIGPAAHSNSTGRYDVQVKEAELSKILKYAEDGGGYQARLRPLWVADGDNPRQFDWELEDVFGYLKRSKSLENHSNRQLQLLMQQALVDAEIGSRGKRMRQMQDLSDKFSTPFTDIPADHWVDYGLLWGQTNGRVAVAHTKRRDQIKSDDTIYRDLRFDAGQIQRKWPEERE